MPEAFFQHVGEADSERDFPRTLVSNEGQKVRFQFSQIERFLDIHPDEKRSLALQLSELIPEGFQIWGVPAGAKSVMNAVRPSDVLLLLRTWGREGRSASLDGFLQSHAASLTQHRPAFGAKIASRCFSYWTGSRLGSVPN
jgi:hypothetical protein